MAALHSGRWAISGAYAGEPCFERRFARAFAEFNGVAFCTPTTSGTASLTIALLALDVGPGDEVLVPGLTWVACASAVLAVGAVPVLVDVSDETLAMSPTAARAAISSRTRAIMLVHPFCTLGDLDAFTTLSRERRLPLIEDCSQAHGAAWRGRRVGTFGSIGCFSMQQSKVLTSGEGGALLTNDPQLHDRIEQLRSDGRRFVTPPRRGRLELAEVGKVQGRNLCLSEFQAAVLLGRLASLDAENALRADRARVLESLLAQVAGVRPLARPSMVTTPTYYNFVLRIDIDAFGGNSIDAIARAVSEELGTLAHPVYRPMNEHPLYQPLLAPRGDYSELERARRDKERFVLPASKEARRTCMTLTHPVLLDDPSGMQDIAVALDKVRAAATELHRLSQGSTREAF